MSKPARQTNFDRVLTVLEEMIPVWRDNSHKTSPAFADFLEKNLEGIKPGAPVHEKAKKSEIAAGQLQFLREILHPSNRSGNEIDDALEKSRIIFGREFPDFFAMIHAKRDKIIERGKIRNEDEYYLIRDLVDELEGEPGRSQLLNKLYMMVDEFAVD
jgi:hypothetical protein